MAGPADRKAAGAYHGGDLKGIQDHLPYLKDLGVTGVWLTPITKNSATGQNPGGAYHGYSASDFYDVEPHYGTLAAFRELVDATHAAGSEISSRSSCESQRSADSLVRRLA